MAILKAASTASFSPPTSPAYGYHLIFGTSHRSPSRRCRLQALAIAMPNHASTSSSFHLHHQPFIRLPPIAPPSTMPSSRLPATMQSSKNPPRPAVERILAGLGYFLPFFDGLQYGRFLFAQYPAAEALFRPLFPILRVYTAIPYSNFVAFFAVYLAVVRNPRFSRYVRFNAMQACVLDVLIVLPLIIQRILSPRSGMALDLLVIFYNTVFLFLVVSFVFAVVSCVLGKTPRLPIVADAADNQLW